MMLRRWFHSEKAYDEWCRIWGLVWNEASKRWYCRDQQGRG